MSLLATLLFALQAPCVDECPTLKLHAESVPHTQGGTSGSCRQPVDVCFKLCAGCAADRKACAGCGGRTIEPEKAWKQEGAIAEPETRLVSTEEDWAALWARNGGDPGALPKTDFTKWVIVAVFRGKVLQSERAVLQRVREFDDRVVVTYTTRTPQCGTEPRSVDSLFVRLPRIAGKTWVVEHTRRSFLSVPATTRTVELPPVR